MHRLPSPRTQLLVNLRVAELWRQLYPDTDRGSLPIAISDALQQRAQADVAAQLAQETADRAKDDQARAKKALDAIGAWWASLSAEEQASTLTGEHNYGIVTGRP